MIMERMEYNMEYMECRECMECMECMEYMYIYIYLSIAWNLIYGTLHSYGTYHMRIYLSIYIYTYTWDIPVDKLRMEWDMGHMCVYIYILCLKSNYVLLCMEYFLHLGNFDGTCREIFHTWSI